MSDGATSAQSRFEELLRQMPRIAEQVNRYTTPELQRAAYDDLMLELGYGTAAAVEELHETILGAMRDLDSIIKQTRQLPQATPGLTGLVASLEGLNAVLFGAVR